MGCGWWVRERQLAAEKLELATARKQLDSRAEQVADLLDMLYPPQKAAP